MRVIYVINLIRNNNNFTVSFQVFEKAFTYVLQKTECLKLHKLITVVENNNQIMFPFFLILFDPSFDLISKVYIEHQNRVNLLGLEFKVDFEKIINDLALSHISDCFLNKCCFTERWLAS